VRSKPTVHSTSAFHKHHVVLCIDGGADDHVLLGTDYPYDMGDRDPVARIAAVPSLSDADRALIRGGTAARLLGIATPASGR
jgi:aminocarboxymuconate-semialdehyde decarboxylase